MRPMVLDDIYAGVAYPLTLDGPNGQLSLRWIFRSVEWCDMRYTKQDMIDSLDDLIKTGFRGSVE